MKTLLIRAKTLQILWDFIHILTNTLNNLCYSLWVAIILPNQNPTTPLFQWTFRTFKSTSAFFFFFFFFFLNFAGPILESRDMRAIFQKKGKERQKWAKYLKIWGKVYKMWKYFEKGSLDSRTHETARICPV